MKSILRRAALSFIFAASTAIFSVSQANAGGSWGGSSGGSSGSWGSSGGVSLGSSGSWGSSGGVSLGSSGSWGSSGGSSGGRVGLIGRLGDRIAANRGERLARRASWGSSGGSSGGYATYRVGASSGGYSSGGYTTYSSGMSYGSHGSSGSSIQYYVPMEYSAPVEIGAPIEYGTPIERTIPVEPGDGVTPTPPAPQPEIDTTDSEAVLKVDVPSDAIVYVNNRRTKTPGESRTYVSRNLKPGLNYSYEVRAEVTRNGKKLSQVKLVDLRGGLAKELAFDFDDAEPVVTSLTLNVPANAKVILGGVETNATGTSRTFSTTRLNRGDLWNDYKVVVTVERDGRQVSKEQTLDVKAGDDVKLDFEFNDPAETVAALR